MRSGLTSNIGVHPRKRRESDGRSSQVNPKKEKKKIEIFKKSLNSSQILGINGAPTSKESDSFFSRIYYYFFVISLGI